MYQRAAEFFDEHGEHRQADRERELADRGARDAETGPREPAAGSEEPSSDPQINATRPASAPESVAAGQGPAGVRHGHLSPVPSRQSVRRL